MEAERKGVGNKEEEEPEGSFQRLPRCGRYRQRAEKLLPQAFGCGAGNERLLLLNQEARFRVEGKSQLAGQPERPQEAQRVVVEDAAGNGAQYLARHIL